MTPDDLKTLILDPETEPGTKWAAVENALSQRDTDALAAQKSESDSELAAAKADSDTKAAQIAALQSTLATINTAARNSDIATIHNAIADFGKTEKQKQIDALTAQLAALTAQDTPQQ